MSQRTEQVASLIQHILGGIFARDIEWPEGALATLTKVDVPADLKNANVMISVLPFNRWREVMNVLNKNKSMMHKKMSAELKMKFSPKLHFRLDESPEKVAEIEKLLNDESLD